MILKIVLKNIKKMSKIPTAEEFLKEKFRKIYKTFPESFRNNISEKSYLELHINGRINGIEQNYPEMMIEFAKLHMEAALKEASENAEQKWVKFTEDDYEIDKDSILNAYPLENIK